MMKSAISIATTAFIMSLFLWYLLSGIEATNTVYEATVSSPTITPDQYKMVERRVLKLESDYPGSEMDEMFWLGWRPDHDELAVVTRERRLIQVLDSNSGEVRTVLDTLAPADGVSDISWSRDGNYLAWSVISPQNAIFVYRFIDDRTLKILEIPDTGNRNTLSWSADSKTLYNASAYGQYDDTWKLSSWDVLTGHLINQMFLSDEIQVIASPTSGLLATVTTVNRRTTLQVRSANTFDIDYELPALPERLILSEHISWDANGTQLFGAACEPVTGSCLLWQWNIQSNILVYPFLHTGSSYNIGPFNDIAVSYDGNFLAVNNVSFADYVWNIKGGNVIASPSNERLPITTLDWDTRSGLLALGLNDGTVRIWQVTQ